MTNTSDSNKRIFYGSIFHHISIVFCMTQSSVGAINTLRPRQNGRHFADDIFKRIFLDENIRISIKISLKFVPKGPINNIPTLVQIMAWRRPGDKPLSEPMMVRSHWRIHELNFRFSNCWPWDMRKEFCKRKFQTHFMNRYLEHLSDAHW